MRKIYLLLVAMLFAVTGMMAQITVSGALVGNGSYATLNAAFTAINAGAQTGAAIVISVTGNTTEPATTASLGAGAWATVSITPSGGPWTISGAATAGTPLLELNGADNVTIDGGGNLTISNTTAATTSGTSTIRFVGGATNNTITNCTILGAFTSAAGGTNGGNIWFSTDANTANGNDNNTISSNNIGPVTAGGAISRGIYSNGSVTTTAINNSGNIINANNIYDYAFSATTGISRGIDVGNGSTGWTISNNKLFLTVAKNMTAGQAHYAIYVINTTSGDNFLINGNTIGYSAANGTGIYSIGATPATTQFYAIYLQPQTSAAGCQVNNNIVSDISHSSTYTATTNPTSNFGGITVLANAGVTMNGNTVRNVSNPSTASAGSHINCIYLAGASTGTQTISGNTVTNISRSNTAGAGEIRGIRFESPANVVVSNNTVTNITHNGTGNTGSIWGITDVSSSVNVTVDNNVVDNLTHNATAVGSGTVTGIRSFGIAGNKVYTNNTISNLNGTNASTINGMNIAASSTPNPMTITGNRIFAITGGAITVNGILHSTASTVVNIQKNNVYNLSSTATTAIVTGIGSTNGITNNIINNFVSNLRAPNSANSNAIFGVNVTGGTTANVLHNTIFLGSAGALTSTSATFGGAGVSFNTTPTATNIQNNIINIKASKVGDAYFAAIKFSAAGTAASVPTGFVPRNNIYNAPNIYGEGNVLSTATDVFGANATIPANNNAFFNDVNSTNGQTCNTYKALFTTDQDSYIEDNLGATTPTGAFVPAGDSYANNSNVATTPAVADDYAGTARPAAPDADRGALEFAGTSPAACDGTTVAGTATGPAAVCSNLSAALSATGYTTGKTGLSYQWASSTTAGGPYIDISGATNPTYNTAPLTTPTYFVFKVICGSCGTGTAYQSNEVAIAINTLPTVSVTPTSATFCSPGGTPAALTASGATTYAWTPTAGLSATTGASVNATPAATTAYTVTGTDGNGCIGTAVSTITVSLFPVITSVTATPATICAGDNSQLNAVVTPNANYAVATATYNFEAPSAAVTSIFTTGDDVVSGSQTIPFTFNYYGQNVTTFFACTNGWIQLGGTVPASSGTPFTIPSAAVPNNVVAACFDDLNVTGAGAVVRSFTNGTAPNRVFIVEYDNVKFYNTAANNGNFRAQIKLYETTNLIEIHIGDATDPVASAKTLGIENTLGTLGTSPTGRNNLTWSVAPGTPEAWVFTPGVATYLWSPTTFIPSGQETLINPLATAVSATQIYNVTATANGCTTAPSPVTVTVSSGAAITTQPPATVTVCQGSNAVMTVVASGPGLTYQWKRNGVNMSNAGNVSGATTATVTLTAAVPADNDTYTVEVTSTCGSPVTSNNVVLTVNPKPSVPVSPAGPISICSPATQTLDASGTNAAATIGYQWINGSTAIGGATNATYAASASGSYRVRVQDGVTGCFDTSAVVILTVNPQPSTVTVTPSTPTICAGDIQQLTATGGTLGGQSIIGTGTVVPGSTSFPNPFSAFYGGAKHQMIYTATELSTQGLAANSSINNVALNISAFLANACTNLTIRIKHTSSTVLTGFETGTTTVYGPTTFTPSATGWADFTLTTPFIWNGTDNLIVEFVHNAGNGGNGSGTRVNCTTTTGNATYYGASDNIAGGIAGFDALVTYGTNGASTSRPNVRFGHSAATTITWTPTTGLFTDAAATVAYTGTAATSVYAKPGTTTIYTATATSAATCTNTGTATITATGVIASTPISLTADQNTYAVSGATPYMANCRIIAEVTPTGATPVAGNLLAKTTIVAAGLNGTEPHGPRVTDLEPTIDGSATVKLYFKTADLQAYNTYVTANSLAFNPVPNADAVLTDASNVRIRQFHGPNATFASNTGSELLTPTSVTWDAAGDNGTGWWVVTVSVTNFSSFFLTSTPIITPVTLTNVKAEITSATNTVYWTTTSEQNNRKFVVERSIDGRNFASIGDVATRAIGGNSSVPLSYSFVDVNPVQGKQYYRLQMLDLSGRTTQSQIVTLRRGGGNIEIVDVRPNPTTGLVYFNVLGAKANVNVAIRDLSGKEVIRKGLVQSNSFSVDLSNLANGMYILEAVDVKTNEKAMFKVVKQ